jgi:hypothetical protein
MSYFQQIHFYLLQIVLAAYKRINFIDYHQTRINQSLPILTFIKFHSQISYENITQQNHLIPVRFVN